MQQKASKILMIRPVLFGYNEQTAGSNSFQHSAETMDAATIQQKALMEFDAFAKLLKEAGIDVVIFQDTIQPHTPDSIFPNNWISFHENNTIVLYPMLAPNRRLERRTDIVEHFSNSNTNVIDLSAHEQEQQFLEGTGSIVFDYQNKTAYANRSPRTNKSLLEALCERLQYKFITFKAIDEQQADIYHTNVLMCIGTTFAVLCTDCIPDKKEVNLVVDSLKASKHQLIEISREQMNSFAGNMYQLFNAKGQSFIVMSEQAYKTLTTTQIEQLEQHGTLLHAPLYTIEKYGGGSARCMLADIRY